MKIRTALAVAALCCVATSVHAAEVVVPYGDWITWGLANLEKLFVAVATGAVGYAAMHISPSLAAFLRQIVTDKVIAKAVDYAIGAVDGAVHGKTVNVDIASDLVAEAAKYVVANAPKLATTLGDTLEPKIFSRLSAAGMIPADATATSAGAALPAKKA